VCAYEDKDDENSEALRKNYELLCQSTDQNGKKLKVVKLPMPGNVAYDGKRLPASYANFYVGNRTVLVPTFERENDKVAISILQKLFPRRRVVGVNCVDLICGFGAIHCISLQQPSRP
jgi:agmatine deiminase